MRNMLLVLLALTLAACSTTRGFERGSLGGVRPSERVVTDDDIKQALSLKAQLPSPFRLAVYLVPSPWGYSHADHAWRWLGEDKDRILQLGDELKRKKIISDCILLQDDIVDGSGNKAIRLAAARAGADAVLIVNGTSDVHTEYNAAAFSYALLLPALFVPGTRADALFIASGTIWDVRNHYLYLASEAEGSASETGSAWKIEESRILKTAKADAVGGLADRVAKGLSGMAGK